MITQIKTVIRNSQNTLMQDAIGVGALAVMMIVALHIPGLS